MLSVYVFVVLLCSSVAQVQQCIRPDCFDATRHISMTDPLNVPYAMPLSGAQNFKLFVQGRFKKKHANKKFMYLDVSLVKAAGISPNDPLSLDILARFRLSYLLDATSEKTAYKGNGASCMDYSSMNSYPSPDVQFTACSWRFQSILSCSFCTNLPTRLHKQIVESAFRFEITGKPGKIEAKLKSTRTNGIDYFEEGLQNFGNDLPSLWSISVDIGDDDEAAYLYITGEEAELLRVAVKDVYIDVDTSRRTDKIIGFPIRLLDGHLMRFACPDLLCMPFAVTFDEKSGRETQLYRIRDAHATGSTNVMANINVDTNDESYEYSLGLVHCTEETLKNLWYQERIRLDKDGGSRNYAILHDKLKNIEDGDVPRCSIVMRITYHKRGPNSEAGGTDDNCPTEGDRAAVTISHDATTGREFDDCFDHAGVVPEAKELTITLRSLGYKYQLFLDAGKKQYRLDFKSDEYLKKPPHFVYLKAATATNHKTLMLSNMAVPEDMEKQEE